MNQIIEHSGKIQQINGDQVKVLITQYSACSNCHAKSACTASDSAEKIIEVVTDDFSLKPGDDVIVYGRRSMGMKAVLVAFVVPFLLILLSLLILRFFISNEAVSGMLALAVLMPYYASLFFFKDKLKTSFLFYIKKDTGYNKTDNGSLLGF